MRIEEKRREIDEIDARIVDLLDRRAAIAREISLIKLSAGLPIIDGQRENEIIRRLSQRPMGSVGVAAIARIYRVILDESCRIQAKVRGEQAVNGVSG